ncbi:MAG: hypothetical protein RLZZ337_87 [Bacteroidota bacterium]|jgi:hypothetical protein
MSNEKHLQDLKEIRSLMEKSSRFISLSGMSGVMAGIYALLGAYFANAHFQATMQSADYIPYFFHMPRFYAFYFIVAALVLLFSLATGIFLTARRAKRKGQTIWDKVALRMLVNVGFPLFVGGVFCFAMLYHRQEMMIAPAMLIFYGLGLINGSKYTITDVRILGIIEVILGLLAAFFVRRGIYFWAIGFGVMHIVYGIYMWWKYERKENVK